MSENNTNAKCLQAVVIQADYFAGEDPAKEILSFLFSELDRIPENSIAVLPEYTNATGLSDPALIEAAMSRTDMILEHVSAKAKEKKSYIAVNVLQHEGAGLANRTMLFSPEGEHVFTYQKKNIPPSEIALGVLSGNGPSVFSHNGIRFGCLTCYDIYSARLLEELAAGRPDIIVFPTYQRGERTDIIRAQVKLLAFRCNAYVVRTSCSLHDPAYGGCSMIVSPDGQIRCDLADSIGSACVSVDPQWKYYRSAGFGGGIVRNDVFLEGRFQWADTLKA